MLFIIISSYFLIILHYITFRQHNVILWGDRAFIGLYGDTFLPQKEHRKQAQLVGSLINIYRHSTSSGWIR